MQLDRWIRVTDKQTRQEAGVGPDKLKGRGSCKKKDKRHALTCQCHATNDCGEEALRWQFWRGWTQNLNSRAALGVMRRRGLFLGLVYV